MTKKITKIDKLSELKCRNLLLISDTHVTYSNSHSLVHLPHNCNTNIEPGASYTIDCEGLKEIAQGSTLIIDQEAKTLTITNKNTSQSFRFSDTQFPDWEQIVPKEKYETNDNLPIDPAILSTLLDVFVKAGLTSVTMTNNGLKRPFIFTHKGELVGLFMPRHVE